MSTTVPLSNKLNIAIKNYNPHQLKQFSLHLKQRKENALIVGHSNTTPQLTRLLGDDIVAALSEKDFQNLYQVQFFEGQTLLTKFIQPHKCTSTK